MPLVAMTLEMGSLGNEVAQGIATAMGLEPLHHEIIGDLADKMRVRKSHVVRFLEGGASLMEKLTAERTSLSIYTAAETYELAQRQTGAVIFGWGATQLLRPIGHAVCVRVSAPIDLRVQRMMKWLSTDDENFVRREIDNADEAHAAIMRRHFGVDWQDQTIYDLTLNTQRIPVSQCVEQILALVRSPAFRETPQSYATLENLSLSARVRAALRSDPRTRKANVMIEADAGCVTLAGMVDEYVEPDSLSEVISKVSGVKDTQNLVRQSRSYF
jgi:cytidylate kinase